MQKTTKEIKMLFKEFIEKNTKIKQRMNKTKVLKPYMKQIQEALENKISRRSIFDFLKAQGIEISFKAFNQILNDYKVNKSNLTIE